MRRTGGAARGEQCLMQLRSEGGSRPVLSVDQGVISALSDRRATVTRGRLLMAVCGH